MVAVTGSMPPSPVREQRAPRSPSAIILRRILTSWQGQFGVLVLAVIVALGLLAPWIAPYSPTDIDPDAFSMPPSAAHWFGTDEIGRDVLSRMIWGAQASLLAGVVSVWEVLAHHASDAVLSEDGAVHGLRLLQGVKPRPN